jgi:hypothetical protein
MRSFGVVRTSPVIVSRVRTTTATAIHKQSSTATLSRRKLTTTANVGTKTTTKLLSKNRIQTGTKTSKLKTTQDGGEPSGGGAGGGKGGTGGGTGGTGGTNNPNPGGGTNNPNPGGGTTGGTGGGTTTGGTGGGTTTGGNTGTPGIPSSPPVIVHERRPVYIPTPVTVAPVAPVAVDPPGCIYERSVRKLPGGGLQRVIVKICPDA